MRLVLSSTEALWLVQEKHSNLAVVAWGRSCDFMCADRVDDLQPGMSGALSTRQGERTALRLGLECGEMSGAGSTLRL